MIAAHRAVRGCGRSASAHSEGVRDGIMFWPRGIVSAGFGPFELDLRRSIVLCLIAPLTGV